MAELQSDFQDKYGKHFGADFRGTLDWEAVEEMNELSDGDLADDLLDLESWADETTHCGSKDEALTQILAWYA